MRYGVPRQLALYHKYKDCGIDFVTIYIREAHTRDEWPLGIDYCWKMPKNLEERLHLANRFVKEMEYNIPIAVDSMENPFNLAFSAWPERYYIFHQGKLAYKAMPVGDSYPWEELEEWIADYLKSKND
jgi:hypothetical protein